MTPNPSGGLAWGECTRKASLTGFLLPANTLLRLTLPDPVHKVCLHMRPGVAWALLRVTAPAFAHAAPGAPAQLATSFAGAPSSVLDRAVSPEIPEGRRVGTSSAYATSAKRPAPWVGWTNIEER